MLCQNSTHHVINRSNVLEGEIAAAPIGVACITQIMHEHNRNSNIQGRSPNVV